MEMNGNVRKKVKCVENGWKCDELFFAVCHCIHILQLMRIFKVDCSPN